ncbi:hypothetical protein SAMN05421670_1885 [Psychrobacillus psychrotolerans]|uniref:Phosphate starvation-inducible protein PhoH n=1 Tax=Psychrobacillus psychrotolerans TaxID=126156 RepID=A0A1I5Y3Q7_9BACI|nr:phosphate starvation-inducible protein PhoH [Psychrobacillus psychrotolerans]SFQ38853.1 hypothetical protein SAMN05421670_1885 [Psychrobacillus psychrotolerans]
MKANFIELNPGAIFAQRGKNKTRENFTNVDIYNLSNIDLTAYNCLVISGFADQDFLYEHRQIILDFVNARKILIFSGNLVTDWLPGGQLFVPKEINSYKDYEVSIHKQHPIFEGVLEDDMTYNKGVSGFFARGHHPTPEGAEVLLTLPGDTPITYIDRVSTKGTILVHAGSDLFGYMKPEINKTTDRIGPQLVKWVHEEIAMLQEEVTR